MERNVPLRAGRIRGHGATPSSQGRKGTRPRAVSRPPSVGGFGRTTRVLAKSTYLQGKSNVRRKSGVRRTNPLRKRMRRESIGPAMARVMARYGGEGQRRRTTAQRALDHPEKAYREPTPKLGPGR